MENVYKYDLKRYDEASHATRFLYWFRKAQCTTSRLIRLMSRVVMSYYKDKYGLEIPWQTHIGKGICLVHAYNITINPNAIIGTNCNIHKGIVIG